MIMAIATLQPKHITSDIESQSGHSTLRGLLSSNWSTVYRIANGLTEHLSSKLTARILEQGEKIAGKEVSNTPGLGK